jgi:nucleotide-binding universal stress UspA family protein
VHLGEPLATFVADRLEDPAIRRGIDATADGLLDAAGGPIGVRTTIAPTVAEGLADAARTEAADLIVVGSSRRGAIERIWLGDDACAVLRSAPCAVAVAPSGLAAAPPAAVTDIGVGYAQDTASAGALAVARALRRADATLSVAHIEPMPSTPTPFAAAGVFSVPAREQALRTAQRALAGLEDVDEQRWSLGGVSDGLLDLAEDVDLLVVGLHRRSAIGRLVHGSTAESVLHGLPCALLAVPDAAQPRSTGS